MKNKLAIIGAGGHGHVARDIGFLCGYESVIFLDDSGRTDIEIAGKSSEYEKFANDHDFFVALGDNKNRERLTEVLLEGGVDIVSLIHPSAIIGSNVSIGSGSIVMAGAIINTGTVLCKGVIVNTASSVDHDNYLDDYCHVAVGAHLAGTVRVGKKTFVGAGAIVINNVSICDEVILGAGAVATRDIPEKGTYVGLPAKKIKD